MITLKIVTNADIEFLFDLLKKRDPISNISHKKMPSYSQHIKFIKSKPYSKWYIILKENEKIGSIYLSKNNEIGLIRKCFSILSIVFGIYLSSGLFGNNIHGLIESYLPPDNKVENWIEDLDEAYLMAKDQNKPIFIDFTGNKKMCVNFIPKH